MSDKELQSIYRYIMDAPDDKSITLSPYMLRLFKDYLLNDAGDVHIVSDGSDEPIEVSSDADIRASEEIERLRRIGREHFRQVNSEQLARKKAEEELAKLQNDVLVLVRQISTITGWLEIKGESC